MRSYNHGRFQQQASFLRRQFLQDGELPFANVLSEGIVAQALTATGVVWLDRIYSPLVTLWVFLGQVLNADDLLRSGRPIDRPSPFARTTPVLGDDGRRTAKLESACRSNSRRWPAWLVVPWTPRLTLDGFGKDGALVGWRGAGLAPAVAKGGRTPRRRASAADSGKRAMGVPLARGRNRRGAGRHHDATGLQGRIVGREFPPGYCRAVAGPISPRKPRPLTRRDEPEGGNGSKANQPEPLTRPSGTLSRRERVRVRRDHTPGCGASQRSTSASGIPLRRA